MYTPDFTSPPPPLITSFISVIAFILKIAFEIVVFQGILGIWKRQLSPFSKPVLRVINKGMAVMPLNMVGMNFNKNRGTTVERTTRTVERRAHGRSGASLISQNWEPKICIFVNEITKFRANPKYEEDLR